MRQLRRVVADHDIDVVHAHSSWAGVWARTCHVGVPVIYQPHCYKFADPTTPLWKRLVFWSAERFLAGRAAAVIALTPWEESASRRLRAPLVLTVPNKPTLDPTAEDGAPRSRDVIMVGRVSPQKDPRFFAEIARTTRRLDPSVSFTWVGGGDRDLVRALESAEVVVTGWIGSDTVLRATMAQASLYAHTAIYEGFPLSVLDAAVTRTPVIVRSIAAFTGTGLPSFTTPEEASDIILRTLDDTDRLEAARDITVGLPERLLHAPSARRLEDVYDSVARSRALR